MLGLKFKHLVVVASQELLVDWSEVVVSTIFQMGIISSEAVGSHSSSPLHALWTNPSIPAHLNPAFYPPLSPILAPNFDQQKHCQRQ